MRESEGAAAAAAAPDAWGLAPGASIGQGRSIVKRLGGGGHFDVYLVWDERLFALAVAKILRPSHAAAPRALRDLAREAETLGRLAHPVIVRGFGLALDGQYPHILLEHMEGHTLRRLIKRSGPLGLDQLLPLALHVAAALHYLAVERVVHLDIKPANLVMGAPPRVIDFSIARSFEDAVRVRSPIGTDAYMAPEQCIPVELASEIGPRSDVWGLGATLYHSIAGGVPFPRPEEARHSPDPATRFPQLIVDAPPLPRSAPHPLPELVDAMLARDPADRPDAAEIASELEPLVAGLPRRLSRMSRAVGRR